MLLPLIVSVTKVHFPISSRNFTATSVLKKAVGETFAFFMAQPRNICSLSLFSTKLFQNIFSCQNIGAKTTEYYFLTIIDHSYVISFWYSRNIESPKTLGVEVGVWDGDNYDATIIMVPS